MPSTAATHDYPCRTKQGDSSPQKSNHWQQCEASSGRWSAKGSCQQQQHMLYAWPRLAKTHDMQLSALHCYKNSLRPASAALVWNSCDATQR
jgi:hypothetical protein